MLDFDLAGLGETWDIAGTRRVQVSAMSGSVDKDGCLESVGRLKNAEVVPWVDRSIGEDNACPANVCASIVVVCPVDVGHIFKLKRVTAGVFKELECDQL